MIKKFPWLDDPRLNFLKTVLDEYRFIGGCVRDSIVNGDKTPIDIDVATPVVPDNVIEKLVAIGLKPLLYGYTHGTVALNYKGLDIQITTLRKDIETDGRYAKVSFGASWEDDVKRRDFTINAMAVDALGNFYDYENGLEDLKEGRLKFIGDADIRIKEDYLRILRLFRFYSRYGKCDLDPNTLEACRNNINGLDYLSRERIWNEIYKLFETKNLLFPLRIMKDLSILNKIFPFDASIERLELWIKLENALKKYYPVLEDPLLKIFSIIPYDYHDWNNISNSLKLSNQNKHRINQAYQGRKRCVITKLEGCIIHNLDKLEKREIVLAECASNIINMLETPAFGITGGIFMRYLPELEGGPYLGTLVKEAKNYWYKVYGKISEKDLIKTILCNIKK